jgi:phosphoserine phosphatase RsbU/P
MTEVLRGSGTTLPHGAVQLLDAYTRAHGGTGVRIWSWTGRDWLCVYPEGFGSLPGPSSPFRATVNGAGSAYELELDVDGPRGRQELEFMARALEQVLAHENEARSAAHELSERYEEINLLYTISEILASFLSMEKATTRILEEVADVLGARRAALWVADPAHNRLELTAAVGEESVVETVDIDDPASVTARVFRERQPINLERGDSLPRPTHSEPRPHGEEPYLSVPVSFTPPDGGSRTVGVITLVGRRTDVRFSAGDLRLLTAIASQVGAALETQRLVRASLRRERFERELELAHDLQLKLLPDAARFAGTAQVAARCAPAESVGGDLYHLFEMTHGRLGVVIGDVSGHGFGAALIMALTMSAVAIYTQESSHPGDVLRQVHHALIDELERTEMYLTILFAVVDPETGEVRYSNAGHPHAFLVRGTGEAARLEATSPPLGTAPLPDYGEETLTWDRDDLLFLFTDGLSDAFATDSAMSGEQRLLSEIVGLRAQEPAAILDRIFKIAGSSRPHVPPDDRTAVLVRS